MKHKKIKKDHRVTFAVGEIYLEELNRIPVLTQFWRWLTEDAFARSSTRPVPKEAVGEIADTMRALASS